MARITVDRAACEGYGNCVQAAPSMFDLDDDDVVVLLRDELEQDSVGQAEEAALACPVRAIRIDES